MFNVDYEVLTINEFICRNWAGCGGFLNIHMCDCPNTARTPSPYRLCKCTIEIHSTFVRAYSVWPPGHSTTFGLIPTWWNVIITYNSIHPNKFDSRHWNRPTTGDMFLAYNLPTICSQLNVFRCVCGRKIVRVTVENYYCSVFISYSSNCFVHPFND